MFIACSLHTTHIVETFHFISLSFNLNLVQRTCIHVVIISLSIIFFEKASSIRRKKREFILYSWVLCYLHQQQQPEQENNYEQAKNGESNKITELKAEIYRIADAMTLIDLKTWIKLLLLNVL